MMKLQEKGTFEYLKRKKKQNLLIMLISFAVVFAVFFAGLAVFKSRNNYCTLIATVLVLPAAKSGVIAGIVLGIGRAIGETMAVLMVTGNAAVIPTTILEPLRTIPATIAAELGEAPAGGPHYQALFLLGVVLFFITLIINFSVEYISSKGLKRSK